MKRLSAVALIICLCFSVLPALASETGTVNAKAILRKSADKESKALQTLSEGEQVTLLSASGDWYKVSYGKYTGYMMKKYVAVSKSSVVANSSKIKALGDAPGPMRVGDAGDDVIKLQKALDILGYYDGRIDGSYGSGTTTAVAAYQKDQGMEADGVAGRDTVKSIFGSVGKATAKPAASSEKTASGSSATKSTGLSVSSIEEIGNAPNPSKEGDSGSKVTKLQQALSLLGYYSGEIDGNYGPQTTEAVKKLQKKRDMKQDGVAGSSTIRVIFGSSSSGASASSSSSKSESGSKSAKTETLDWFADGVSQVIPKNAKFTIKDVRTGKTFTAVRWSGVNHLDAEPATAADTAAMKSIFGGEWSWNRRAVLIQYKGHVYAASMNGMPHGTTTINSNGYDGHFCIHFKNSKTHGTEKVDADHQNAVSNASRASW